MTNQLAPTPRRAKAKRVTDYSRARDEQILDWVARRAAGESCYSIAEAAGVARGQVVAATSRVKDADFAHNGDTIFVGDYWE